MVEGHSKGDRPLSLAANPFEGDAAIVGIDAGIGEVFHLGMCEGCAESEISAFERVRVDIIHQTFSVDDISHPSVDSLQSDVIPVVGLDEMIGIGVFAQDDGLQPFLFHRGCITGVATESCGGVPIAAISHIIHLQGIVICELASISSAFVSHPEAVEVADADFALVVAELWVGDDTCVIFDDGVARHLVFVP